MEGFDKKYNLRNGRKRPAHIDILISEVDTVKCGRLNELGINGVDLHNNTTPSEKCIVANIHQGSNCFSELIGVDNVLLMHLLVFCTKILQTLSLKTGVQVI